jgi:hypothetical protein
VVRRPGSGGDPRGAGDRKFAISERQRITQQPQNDAKLIAETLRGLGFSLVGDGPQIDLDLAAMTRKVNDLGELAKSADVALFYYSGKARRSATPIIWLRLITS